MSLCSAAADPKRQELETYIQQAIQQYEQLKNEGRNEEAGRIAEEINHLNDMLAAMPAPAGQPASTGRSAAPPNTEEAAASFHAAKNQREQAMAKNRGSSNLLSFD